MLITHNQMWKRFNSLMKDKPSDFKIKCPICDKEIISGEDDIEYVKTKRGSELFMHSDCAAHWGSSAKGGDR